MPKATRLLQRQLRTCFPAGPPPGLEGFLAVVADTYRRHEKDRELLERSLELSSDELLQANTELRGLLQALPDLFFVVDAAGRVISWRAREDTDFFRSHKPTDMVGRSLAEIPVPGMRGRFLDAVARVGAGEPMVRIEFSLAFHGPEQHFETRLVRLQEGQVLCIVRDLTELRRAEEALRRSEEHYRLLFDANPQPMWVFDRETFAFLAVNQAAVTHYGWSQEEFLRMTAKDIRPPDEIPALLAVMDQLGEEPLRPGVFRHRRKDGTPIDVETIGNPLLFYGRPAVLVLANDVTERRRLEEQFRQAQRMEAVGRLAGGVAHDFNNLLTVITGYSELLQNSLKDRVSALHRVQEIHRAAARAAALTRQLLAFSRKQVLEPRVLDLNEVVQGLVPMLGRLLGEHVRLEAPLALALGRVKADPGQIEQVVMNLAINARDAMPEGGTVRVELADVALDAAAAQAVGPLQAGPHVRLTVTDTGCGMDPVTQARIFEPFFTTKEIGKGTGLGLATVYGIIQQSEGGIRVESAPGQGTVFQIFLPCVGETAPAAEAGAGAAGAVTGRETVLIVEDEDILRALEREMLVTHGYRVLVARDAAEALELERRTPEPIALLVTDMIMPGRNGRELAEEFRRRRPGTRVLYVSGYANDTVVDRGLLEDAAGFLQKPFSADALARKVREGLDAEP